MLIATKWTLADIKKANRDAGQHWFSHDTMRFFQCRVSEEIYQGLGGIYFVSSEKGPYEDSVRKWSTRCFDPETASISTKAEFNTMSRDAAHRLAAKLATFGGEP